MGHQALIVEDDSAINQLVAEILRAQGFGVTQAFSGTEALLQLEHSNFDLLILDLMLPGMTGEEVLCKLRKTSNMPVIVLSAKEAPQDRASVLRLGADDFLTKPFYEEELLARIEAVLRRVQPAAAPGAKLIYKDLTLDGAGHKVWLGEEELSLTGREFAILALLMENPSKVFTKANLYQSVWKEEFLGDDNTVNVHISNLRAKLGPGDYIQTVWGIGFKMADG